MTIRMACLTSQAQTLAMTNVFCRAGRSAGGHLPWQVVRGAEQRGVRCGLRCQGAPSRCFANRWQYWTCSMRALPICCRKAPCTSYTPCDGRRLFALCLVVLAAVCGASASPHLCSFTVTQDGACSVISYGAHFFVCRATWTRRGSCSQRCRRQRGRCCCPQSRLGCTWTRCSASTLTPSRQRYAAVASPRSGTSWSSNGDCCAAHTRDGAPAVTDRARAALRWLLAAAALDS